MVWSCGQHFHLLWDWQWLQGLAILLAYLYYSYTHCVFRTGGLACNSNLVWQYSCVHVWRHWITVRHHKYPLYVYPGLPLRICILYTIKESNLKAQEPGNCLHALDHAPLKFIGPRILHSQALPLYENLGMRLPCPLPVRPVSETTACIGGNWLGPFTSIYRYLI